MLLFHYGRWNGTEYDRHQEKTKVTVYHEQVPGHSVVRHGEPTIGLTMDRHRRRPWEHFEEGGNPKYKHEIEPEAHMAI